MQFVVTYLGLIIAASLFIVGWYSITRHTLRMHPDGTIWSHGYLFSWWSEYWEQVVGQKKVYYQGDALEEKYLMILRERPSLGFHIGRFPEKKSLSISEGYQPSPTDIEYLENTIAAGVEIKDRGIVFLYELEPVYKFPEWVREPVSSCPVCMASVYGSLVWFTFTMLFPTILGASSHPEIARWGLWPLYCITVSAVNKWLVKKIGL